MGIIGYELIVLGFACMIAKVKWLLPVKTYLMMLFLTAGFGLASAAWWKTDSTLGILLGGLGAVWFILLLYSIFKRKGRMKEVVHIPADSYEIAVVDRMAAPTIQLSYLLKYQGKSYVLSTSPPEGRPALFLHVKHQKEEGILSADIAIDTTEKLLSVKQRLQRWYGILVLLIALLLPWPFQLYRSGVLQESFLGACITIIVGYVTVIFLKGGKALLHRLLYWFGIFLEVMGLLSLIVYLWQKGLTLLF